MPVRRTLSDGETIESLAREHGFAPATIWDHPENAALKEKRKDPDLLEDGDEIVIPDLRAGVDERPAGQRHRYRRRGPPPRLMFAFRTETGHSVHDAAGFRLVHPGGKSEDGKLEAGRIRRKGVAPGSYVVEFRRLTEARWAKEAAHSDEPIGMLVAATGFGAGTAVAIRVRGRYQSRTGPPLAEISAQLGADSVEATWRHEPRAGEPPAGEFVFEAAVGDKDIESGVLRLDPHPVESVHGVQQRLRYLGYDPGPVDGIAGQRTKSAVRAFQGDHPPLDVDGIAGPLTQGELFGVIGW